MTQKETEIIFTLINMTNVDKAKIAGMLLESIPKLKDKFLDAFTAELSSESKSYLNAYAQCKGF
jgi:hypothetical protein